MYQEGDKKATHAGQTQQTSPKQTSPPHVHLWPWSPACATATTPAAARLAYQRHAAGMKRVAQQGGAYSPAKEDHSGRCDLHDAV